MKKYYVVWEGKKTGIFSTWEECEKNVKGVSGAKYKSFSTLKEAEKAWQMGWYKFYKKSRQRHENQPKTGYIEDSLSVDAAASGNPGPMEYRGVCTKTGETIFHYGPIMGTNNIGEFLAIVHGLAYLKKKNLHYPIYSDSETAIGWVKKKKANTTLIKSKETEKVWQLLRHAEKWLQENEYSNEILKWNTKEWGESKADFGRK